MVDDKEITTNDDIAIEFVEHPAGEPEPEPVPEVEPPAAKPAQRRAEKAADADEMSEKLRLSEERFLRLRADFENYKKRADKINMDQQARCQMELLRKILPFLDNMERAFQNIPEELGRAYAEGLELSLMDLENGLKLSGLEEIAAMGAQFDPASHESLGFESVLEKEDNEIVKVWEKGYLFKGKLLRPAKVFINRKSPGGKDAPEEKKETDNG